MTHNDDVARLTFTGFLVNAAVDDGKGGDLSFEDVYAGLEGGTLLADLDRRYPDTFDFSAFPPGSDAEMDLLEALHSATDGTENRERRKIGVERNGLCLIVGLVLEAIQARHRR